MLIDLLAPVSFIGEQMFRALGPLLPFDGWRDIAHTLSDERQRDLLRHILVEPDTDRDNQGR